MDYALRFTVEYEEDGQLPFMDVQIRRTEGIFEWSVYRKPTFTGVYTRVDFFSPTSQKIGLMKSLTSRAHRICSPSTLSQEIKTLQGIFIDNGYPGHLVQRIVQVAQTTDSTEDRHESTTDPAHFVIMRLPWNWSQQHRIRRGNTEGNTNKLRRGRVQSGLHHHQSFFRPAERCLAYNCTQFSSI